MACRVEFLQNGKIGRVFTPNGERSIAFDKLSSLPFNTNESALEAYKQGLDSTDITFTLNGEDYATYREALLDSTGEDITVNGLTAEGNKIPLQTISSITNPETREGFINNAIKSEILSDTVIKQDGDSFLKAEGYDDLAQIINEQAISQFAYENGYKFKYHTDGRLELTELEKVRSYIDKTYSQVREQFDEEGALVRLGLSGLLSEMFKRNPRPAPHIMNEATLIENVKEAFRTAGFDVTSMERYVENYKDKNGAEPTAEMLIDLANKAVAVSEGSMSAENLTEEFAHLVIENIDQSTPNQLDDALRNVEHTEEYAEFANMYTEVYSKDTNLTPQEVDRKVRKEVLGKIVAKGAVNQLTEGGRSQNIFQYILNQIQNFLESIGINTNNGFKTQVNQLTSQVVDNIINKNINDVIRTDGSTSNRFVYYSLNTQAATPQIADINRELRVILSTLRDQERSLRRRGGGAKAIQEVIDKLINGESKLSLLSTIDFMHKQTEYLERASQTARDNGETLSSEELVVLTSLKQQVLPVVGRINEIVKNDSTLNKLTPSLNELVVRINNIQSMPTMDIMDRIVRRTIDRHQLPDEISVRGKNVNTYDYLMGQAQSVSKDTNLLFSYIGQVSHAKEPLLNLLDSLVSDMIARSRWDFHDGAKAFENRMRELGVKDIGKTLPKFYDKDGYMLSLWDFSKFDKAVLDKTADLFYKHLSAQKASEGKKMELTKEKIRTMLENHQTFEAGDRLDGSFKEEYSRELSKELGKMRQREYNDSYYEDRDNELAALGVPQPALDKLRELAFDRMDIMSRVDMSSGYPTFTLQDKYDLDALNTARTKNKAFYDEDGVLKGGLEVITEREFKNRYPNEVQDGKFVYDNGFVRVGSDFVNLKANPSTEAQVAYGLTKVDANFLEGRLEKLRAAGQTASEYGLTPFFLNQLMQIENTKGKEAAYNFFTANVNLSMADSFYESEFVDDFDAYIDSGQATPDFMSEYDSLKDTQRARREMLKSYRDTKNVMNTMGNKMSPETQNRIKELTLIIKEKKRIMYGLMGETASEFELTDGLETTTNESYKGELRDLGIADNLQRRFAFAMKHVTDPNSLMTLITSLDYLKVGRMPSSFYESKLDEVLPNTSTQELFEQIEQINNSTISLTDRKAQIDELVDQIKVDLAEQRLAPYYKSIAPTGMETTLANMADANSNTTILQAAQELESANVKMTLHQSYYELTQDPDANPAFKKGFKAYKYQPKQEYMDVAKFEDRLKVQVVRDANGNVQFDEYGIPEVVTESNDFQVWKEVIMFKAESLETFNETGANNLYLAPQVSKTLIDKITTVMKGKKGSIANMGEIVREMMTNRVDEQELGQTAEDGSSLFQSTGIRVIPKRYINRLEKSTDVSDDLFYTLMIQRQEAELYKNRKQALMEITAVEDAIAQKKFTNGKKAESTNTYKMAKSYIDYNLYGITESLNWRVNLPILGDVDASKLARTFHKYIRLRNLAFNAIIPATSWLTAEVNINLENWIGQYLDSDSLMMGRKEFRKLFPEAIQDAVNPQRTNRLDNIGQYFGVFDIDRAYENSKFNRTMIAMGKLDMGAHTVGNFSPLSQALLAMLHGHRMYDGRFVDKSQFEQLLKKKTPNIGKKEINNEWKNLKTKNLYSYIVTEKGKSGVDFNFDRLMKDSGTSLSEAEYRKEFKDSMLSIDSKIRKFVERIDGNIPQHEKTQLQRNFIGAFTMTHKGWLSIVTSNRFKSSHFNSQTGQVEEGSYITLARKSRMVVDAFIDGIKKKNMKGFYDALRDTWTNMDRTERLNLQRIAKDQAYLTTIYGMILMLSTMADDDENKDLYALQATAYLMDRVFNETKSAQSGVMGELSDSASSPIVGYDNLLNTMQIWKVFDGKEITRGNYRGMTGSQKYFIDNVPGFKHAFVISSGETLYNQRNSYNYFNGRDDWNLASMIISSKDFKEWVEEKE